MKLSLEASSAAENVAVAPPSHSLSSPSRSSNPGGSAGCACVMCPMLRVPEIIVSAPAVRQNGRSWTHGVANKRHEAGTRSIGHMTHAHPAEPLGLLDLDGDDNE